MSTDTQLERQVEMPDPVWRRILAQPERAPELIALAAAERFAKPAARWVQVAGAGHDGHSLAREAYKKNVRLSRVEGFALGFGGVITSAGNLAGLMWIQARMVYFIAASHGYDPAHPMRPAELLALWEVYDTPAAARESLDGMGPSMAETVIESKLGGRDQARLRERLVRYVSRRLFRRFAGRLIPVVSAPISAVQNGSSTKELGKRALAYYGGDGLG